MYAQKSVWLLINLYLNLDSVKSQKEKADKEHFPFSFLRPFCDVG